MVSLLLIVIFLCGLGFALHAWRQHRKNNLQSDQVGLVEDYYNYYDGYHTMKWITKTRDMGFNWSCMPSVLDMMLADVTWIRKSVVCSLPVDEKVCNSFYPSKRGRKREYIHWNCKDNLFQLLCRNSWEIALALVYQSWLRTALYADNQLLICDLGNMSAFPISLIFVRRCFKLWAVIHSS